MVRDTQAQDVVLPRTVERLKIVLLYAAFASLWILLSDKAMEWLFRESPQNTVISTLKGWAFVAVTSFLLYRLMGRLAGRPPSAESAAVGMQSLAWPLGLLAAAVVAMTGLGIGHSLTHQKEKEVARLQAIADLKTRQIEAWLAERFGDARFVRTNRLWGELYHRWRHDGDTAGRDLMLSRLREFVENRSFQSALLLDEQMEALWSTEEQLPDMNPALLDAVRGSFGGHGVIHLGPYRDDAGSLRLDFIAPLPSSDGRTHPVIILRVDPSKHLFAMLETWPVPSATGETLLFRKESDHVVYLNELRHRAETAVAFRRDVADEKLLAAQVLREEAKENSPVEGKDYRGIPAMGIVRSIQGTDWFLVAKLDHSELYADMTRDVTWIALFGLLTLFMTGGGLFLFRQRQELAASLRERQIQSEKLRALQLLGAIAESSADAIFAKDVAGRYLLFNHEASRIAGKPAHEVIGQDDTAIFPPEQAALIRSNDRKVMQEDRTVTFQEDLSTVDGEATFLATKGPLKDTAGNVVGTFGISRNITELKRTEDALRTSLDEKVALLREVHHRVKNNLQIVASLLSLQAGRTPNPEALDVLRDTHNRVRSMALLHEVLYRSGNLARINFALYARDLCAQLLPAYGAAASQVKVDIRVEDIGLPLEQSVPCGLIINELVSNALKHGFPGGRGGSILLELVRTGEGMLTLTVSDEGVGLPDDLDRASPGSLGLRLVSRLVAQLKGSLAVESGAGRGTRFRVDIPVSENSVSGELR